MQTIHTCSFWEARKSLIDMSDGHFFMNQKGLALGNAILHSGLMAAVLAIFILDNSIALFPVDDAPPFCTISSRLPSLDQIISRSCWFGYWPYHLHGVSWSLNRRCAVAVDAVFPIVVSL